MNITQPHPIQHNHSTPSNDSFINNEDAQFFSTLKNSLTAEELLQQTHRPFIKNAVDKLSFIETFVILIETTDTSQLFTKTSKFDCSKASQPKFSKKFSKKIISMIEMRILDLTGMEYLTENFILSERAQIFVETCKDHSEQIINLDLDVKLFFHNQWTYNQRIDVINKFIIDLRQRVQSASFRQKLAHRKEKSKRQLKSMHALVDDLLNRQSRLLIVRVDLAYENSQPCNYQDLRIQSEAELESIIEHRKQFTNNMRHNKNIFCHCAGYILKLEQGIYGGYHLHGFFLFNGSQVRSDYFYGDEIGKYWKKITSSSRIPAEGRYFNCSASPFKYQRIGIGLVNYYDFEKIKIIKTHVLSYFAKESMYFLPRALKNIRTLTRSEIPSQALKRSPRGPKRAMSNGYNIPLFMEPLR